MNIKFTTKNWNNILKRHPKVNINEFNEWFRKISTKYKFIKDVKNTFKKDSKGVFSAQEMPSLTFGEEKSWDDLFFVNHGIFFESFVKELESEGFNYWQEYWNCLSNKENISVDGYVNILSYAVDNDEFYQKNSETLSMGLSKLKEKVIESKLNLKTIEDVVKIYLSLILNTKTSLHVLLKEVSELLNLLSEKSVVYYIKALTSANSLQNFEIKNEGDIHPLIVQKINELRNYDFVEDSAIYFNINLMQMSINTKKSNFSLTLAIQTMMDLLKDIEIFKDVYFYEMRLNNNVFMLKAMLKNNKDHIKLKLLLEYLLDVCEDEKNDENTEYEVIFNKFIMKYENTDNQLIAEHKIVKF